MFWHTSVILHITTESGLGRHYHEKKREHSDLVSRLGSCRRSSSKAPAMCLSRRSGGFGLDIRADVRDPRCTRCLAQYSSIGFLVVQSHICAMCVLVCESCWALYSPVQRLNLVRWDLSAIPGSSSVLGQLPPYSPLLSLSQPFRVICSIL